MRGLVSRGWSLGGVEDGGATHGLAKTLRAGTVALEFADGCLAVAHDADQEIVLGKLALRGDATAIERSEIVCDLESLRG